MLDRPVVAAPANPIRGGDRVGSAAVGEMFGLRMMLVVLRRRRLPLLACAVVVPLLALLAIHRITPRYTATGALIYEPSEYKVRELQSILRVDPTTEAVMASQAEILQSLHIAQKLAERGNLYASAEFNPALRSPGWGHRMATWLRWVLGMEVDPPPDTTAGPALEHERTATLVAVQASLRAHAVRFSRVIEVSFTAEDPVVAAAAVNNAMDVYIKDQYAAKQRAVRRATDWLEKRAAELRVQVQQSEDSMASYRAQQRLSQGMHGALDAEQISHLSEDLARARAELANAEARVDAARGRSGAAALAAIAPSVVQLRSQQEQLTAQLQGQQARLGAHHPEAESLRQQLADAQRAVAAEIGRVIAASEAEKRAADDRVTVLERDLRDAQREADRAAQAQIPLNAVMRDTEASRAQLQAVLERIQQIAQQAAIETPDAHEISEALPPQQPSWPRTVPMMAVAVGAGVLLGLLLVYLLQLADTTLHSGDDARALAGEPCFALLPEVGRRALGHLAIEEFVARRPLSAFAEQIRALRAGLWLGTLRPRVIAVTSARPGEGKTVVTLALGRSASLAGERVVAVECDLHHAEFVRRLSGGSAIGLAEVLRGETTLGAALQNDPLTGLAYLPAGKPSGELLGLFMSDAMRRLLATLSHDYDLVLLDSPPVQAVTEARIVTALADATVLCIRWRSTPRDVLQHALALLEDARAHLVGSVLSRVDPRAHVRSGAADAEVYHRRSRSAARG